MQAAQLSTAGRVTRARAAKVFAAEHTMTAALVQACLDQGRRLLYTGGCFDWGDHGDEWITEDTALSRHRWEKAMPGRLGFCSVCTLSRDWTSCG